jgi:mannose-6-phosphate isomerase-like protein (cupin superfamily)
MKGRRAGRLRSDESMSDEEMRSAYRPSRYHVEPRAKKAAKTGPEIDSHHLPGRSFDKLANGGFEAHRHRAGQIDPAFRCGGSAMSTFIASRMLAATLITVAGIEFAKAEDAHQADIEALRQAMVKYEDPYVAVRDLYLSTVGCVHYDGSTMEGHLSYAKGAMGIHFVNLTVQGPPDPLRPNVLVYEPQADTVETPLQHASSEGGYVVEGELEVTVGDEVRILKAGEAYLFDSRIPHRFRNVSDKRTIVISACTPPYL